MLYNVTTMATTWHTVATRDTRLLRRQLETISSLPSSYIFLNYLRCHDDIGWGLDYPLLAAWGQREVAHKRYLNEYFLGDVPGSMSRGALYNADPVTGDARFCGTTASMCGIEVAGFEGDAMKMDVAVQLDVMLHAYMLTQSGMPIIYSGDELAQVNDYSYRDDPEKAEDSRYIHRGAFPWDLVDNIDVEGSVQQRVFDALRLLERVRCIEPLFSPDARLRPKDYSDRAILWLVRECGGETLHAVFNFSDMPKTVWMPEAGEYVDLLAGEREDIATVELPAWGFFWKKRGW